MEIVIGVVALVVGVVVGRSLGRQPTVPEYPDLRSELDGLRSRITVLAGEIRSGRIGEEGEKDELASIREALEGWGLLAEVRDDAIRTALRRVHAYLVANVDGPLSRGLEGQRALGAAARQAQGAVQDLEFFLADPSGDTRRHDLGKIVRDTVRDFTNEWDISVRVGLSPAAVHVMANGDTLMDALYLVLHNAAQFGNGTTVTTEVQEQDGWGRVLIRDDGPGFTAEALSRAYDPFYSTSDRGLGLGLSHARMAVERQGGRIHLRNAEEGGAVVEISLPVTQ